MCVFVCPEAIDSHFDEMIIRCSLTLSIQCFNYINSSFIIYSFIIGQFLFIRISIWFADNRALPEPEMMGKTQALGHNSQSPY